MNWLTKTFKKESRLECHFARDTTQVHRAIFSFWRIVVCAVLILSAFLECLAEYPSIRGDYPDPLYVNFVPPREGSSSVLVISLIDAVST